VGIGVKLLGQRVEMMIFSITFSISLSLVSCFRLSLQIAVLPAVVMPAIVTLGLEGGGGDFKAVGCEGLVRG
jgi:hypothetical protein